MKLQENKRKSERRRCWIPVIGKEGSLFDNILTVNIGGGGIGFISEKYIPINQSIIIQLDLTPEGEPLFVEGQVQWVQQIEDQGKYRIGLKFNKSDVNRDCSLEQF